MKQIPIDFDDFVSDKIYCHSFVATAILGAAAVGGIATAYSANKASQAQQQAAQNAANINEQQLQNTQNINTQNQANLAPFRAIGTDAYNILAPQLPALTTPTTAPTFSPFVAPDIVNDINAPGYDFTRTQGLKAVQNSAAARGLGSSGAALKGAATFATGLANSTYGDVYNRALAGYTTNRDTSLASFGATQTAQSNAFNRLSALINTGASVAGAGATAGNQSALIGTSGANNVGSNIIAGGNAQAAGYNAIGGAISNAANTVGGYALAKGLYGNNNPTPQQQATYEGNYNTPANSSFG